MVGQREDKYCENCKTGELKSEQNAVFKEGSNLSLL